MTAALRLLGSSQLRARALALPVLIFATIVGMAAVVRSRPAAMHRILFIRLGVDAGIGVVAPITALVVATAVLGRWVDAGGLSYVLCRPVARWRLAVAAWLTGAGISAVLAGAAAAVAALVSGVSGRAVVGVVCATAATAVAYGSVFTVLGMAVRRPLIWGLAYVLLWDGFVATSGGAAAQLSIRAHGVSLLGEMASAGLRGGAGTGLAAAAVFAGVVAASILELWRRLARADLA